MSGHVWRSLTLTVTSGSRGTAVSPAGSAPSFDGPAGRGAGGFAGRGDRGGAGGAGRGFVRDAILGKTVRITRGVHKGKIGTAKGTEGEGDKAQVRQWSRVDDGRGDCDCVSERLHFFKCFDVSVLFIHSCAFSRCA